MNKGIFLAVAEMTFENLAPCKWQMLWCPSSDCHPVPQAFSKDHCSLLPASASLSPRHPPARARLEVQNVSQNSQKDTKGTKSISEKFCKPGRHSLLWKLKVRSPEIKERVVFYRESSLPGSGSSLFMQTRTSSLIGSVWSV